MIVDTKGRGSQTTVVSLSDHLDYPEFVPTTELAVFRRSFPRARPRNSPTADAHAVPADDSQKARTALSLSIIIIYSIIDVLTQTNILKKKLSSKTYPFRREYRTDRTGCGRSAARLFFLFVFNDFQTNFFYIYAR